MVPREIRGLDYKAGFGVTELNMKISMFAGVLLLSAAVLSMEKGDKVKHDVDWFTKQHIGKEMQKDDCINVIKGREIKKDDGRCKWSNTFIRAPLEDVKAVCQTGKRVGNYYQSTTPFDLIDCQQTKEMAAKKELPCEYNGEFKAERFIVIGCDKYGSPVHFQEFIPE
ncbi:ribonuclease pancreatic-like [Perca fluviatilis]|uniref:ribonuclease pancreatic-like n=1 Tax=Perca fluviatilis TaxID=8168 RepID=UPI001963B07D|nr:ribonuclease pancreatic-like [Perca fluviatilis]